MNFVLHAHKDVKYVCTKFQLDIFKFLGYRKKKYRKMDLLFSIGDPHIDFLCAPYSNVYNIFHIC
jgi:hypothetical protein